MATYYPAITDAQAELIRSSPLFFIATVDPALALDAKGGGPINLSPRGGSPLHILGPNRVAFLDFEGSANETARHSRSGAPITVMVCSFEEGNAAIVRLFGKARVSPLADSPLAAELLGRAERMEGLPPRQVVEIEIDRTSTACGYGVPVMSFVRNRRPADRGRRFKG